MANVAIRSFRYGELAPTFYGATSLAAYQSGLRTLQNAYVMRQGGVQNRPGTEYLGRTANDGEARLFGVDFDDDQGYVVEMGYDPTLARSYLRLWLDGERVVTPTPTTWTTATPYTRGDVVEHIGSLDPLGAFLCIEDHTSGATTEPYDGVDFEDVWYFLGTVSGMGGVPVTYELPAPYTADELDAVQFAITEAGTAVFVHPNHAPRALVRVSATEFTFDEIDFTSSANVPQNLAVSGTGGTGWGYRVTAIVDGVESGAEVAVRTNIVATLDLQTSVFDVLNASPRTVTWDAVTGATAYRIYANTSDDFGFFWVHQVTTNAFSDDGTIWPVITVDPPTATPPAITSRFQAPGDYPGAVGAYQQRLVFGATTLRPDVIDASVTGDPLNFNVSTPIVDSDAIEFRLVGRRLHRVRHFIETAYRFYALTSFGEVVVQGYEDAILTPDNLNPRMVSQNGAATIPQPVVANDAVIYVQARGSIVRDLFPSSDSPASGTDLTTFAAHLVDGYTFTAIAFQQTPHQIVWLVRSDGTLLSLTYVRESGVLGWAKHQTDGAVESVCVVPENNRDALYAIVRRTINGNTRRYVERFDNREADAPIFTDASITITGCDGSLQAGAVSTGGGNQTVTFTVNGGSAAFTDEDVGRTLTLVFDSGETEQWVVQSQSGGDPTCQRTGTDSVLMNGDTFPPNVGDQRWTYSAIPGFTHLAAESVSAFGQVPVDGQTSVPAVALSAYNTKYNQATVTAGGVLNPQCAFAELTVGLPYVTDIQTLDIDASGITIKDKGQQVGGLIAWVEDTGPFYAAAVRPVSNTSVSGMEEQVPRDADGLPMDNGETLTGVMDNVVFPRWNNTGRVFVRHVDPVPLTILALAPQGHWGGR